MVSIHRISLLILFITTAAGLGAQTPSCQDDVDALIR
jgi:hypothetical protein